MQPNLFLIFEGVMFLLPAFPSNFYHRLLILLFYLFAHYIGIQREYIRLKKRGKPLVMGLAPSDPLYA